VNSETRTALIELWRDVPGCKPVLDCSPSSDVPGCWRVNGQDMHTGIVASLARDAIVEYITAMDAAYDSHGGRTVDTGRCQTNAGDWYVHIDGRPPAYGPTRLSALIAAARAVQGAERGE